MTDPLQEARESYDRRAWSESYQAFLHADRATPLESADVERLATSAYLLGRDLEFQGLMERLHGGYVEAREPERAARCAFWLALTFMLRGEVGQANAWVVRGQRLVEGRDCVEHGYLLLPLAEQEIREGKVEAMHAAATRAVSIGERCGDADLAAAARHTQGRARIRQGQVPAGLGLLDETMLAVVRGELSPIMTGLLYCSVISACREVYAFGRAREWTLALSRWCEQQSQVVAFTGACLVHRAEILQFQGAWPDALSEACRACERAQQAERKPPGAALYQQGEIHRLRGQFAEAEDAYRSASQVGYEPQPGLALLRLAEGRTDAAGATMRRLMSATTDRRRRARLLPAHLDIMLATGDLPEAARAGLELEELAEMFDAVVLRAVAAQARGAIDLAEGDARAALGPLRRAFALWERLEAPYESARARVLIGQACGALGDDEACALECEAARDIFGRLGARPDLVRLDALGPGTATSRKHPLTAREREVLRLISAGNTNRAIAEALCVSARTVDRHVGNIFSKLGVSSRAAATAYAYDHKLF
jgi:ATP/maltotriose-dependent transcriptional regulator MalT